MKILAVYGSNFGQAEAVLRRVAAVLENAGHTVSVYKGDALPTTPAVDSFDAYVVAASIIIGKHQRYVTDFVERNVGTLNGRPSAFISVNGASPESSPDWRAEAEHYGRQFLAQTGWTPRWTAEFAGALRYRHYNFIARWIMTRISRSHGGPTDTSREYEFTDWPAVDRFAKRVAEGLAELKAETDPMGCPTLVEPATT